MLRSGLQRRDMATSDEQVPVRSVNIGVLALQGSFREHISMLRRLPGVNASEVRNRQQLLASDGLIIPGQPSLPARWLRSRS